MEGGAVGRRRDTLSVVFLGSCQALTSQPPSHWNKSQSHVFLMWMSINPRTCPISFLLSWPFWRALPRQGPGTNIYKIPNWKGNWTSRIHIRAGRIYYSGSEYHTPFILNNIRRNQKVKSMRTPELGTGILSKMQSKSDQVILSLTQHGYLLLPSLPHHYGPSIILFLIASLFLLQSF